jgi:hypothetical protein
MRRSKEKEENVHPDPASIVDKEQGDHERRQQQPAGLSQDPWGVQARHVFSVTRSRTTWTIFSVALEYKEEEEEC